MPINKIVLIVLRLFAIQWIVQGIAMLLPSIGSIVGHSSWNSWQYITPFGLLIIGVAVWRLSPMLSQALTRRDESVVNISGLSKEDVYCFAFVFLGLYFVLSSIAPALNWLHFFMWAASQQIKSLEQHTSFYQLSSSLITLGAGFTALAAPRKWANILIRQDDKVEPPLSPQV